MIGERDSLYLGNLGPIPLYAHWSALLMVYMIYNSSFSATGQFVMERFILALIVLILGIILHELGHGLTARLLGAFGVTITLWAFGGLCKSTRDSLPRRELLIVAAGPLVSFILAGIGYGGLWLVRNYQPELVPGTYGGESLLVQFLHLTGYINLWMGCFNMLPIYPLDGGQLVYNLILGLSGRQLLARQVCLTMTVIGALGFMMWTYENNNNQVDQIVIRQGMMMGWLTYNAFTYLR